MKNHLKRFVLWIILPLIKLYRILVEEPNIFVCFSENELFQDPMMFISQDNPYRRALRPQTLKYLDFSVPIEKGDILSYKSLAANRLLLTTYEQDFILLPQEGLGTQFNEFSLFYSPELRGQGALIRPELEACIFGFLNNEIKETENTSADLEKVLNTIIKSAQDNTQNLVMEAILNLNSLEDRKNAAKLFLIQLAPDFLVESSAMVKNLPGSFGEIGSELFKVVIDEYGYGVHSTKHSTLFQNTLNSVQLGSGVHDYWQFYLTSSLLLNNYFNWICTDHSKIFRYLGALFFAETTFIKSCKDWAETLKEIFGDEIDVNYFQEHVHIDFYHSKILKRMIESAVTKHDVQVIPEIIRGIKEAELISKIADDDLIEQIEWINSTSSYKGYGEQIFQKIDNKTTPNTPKYQEFVETENELSVTHVHDKDELCYIVEGEMKFVTGPDTFEILEAGDAIVIFRNRLHGAIITSAKCVYRIYTIGNYKTWLN